MVSYADIAARGSATPKLRNEVALRTDVQGNKGVQPHLKGHHLQASEVQKGLVAWLSKTARSDWLNSQSWMVKEALGHPVVIIDQIQQGDVNVVLCCQMTGFHRDGITVPPEARWPSGHHQRRGVLPIKHNDGKPQSSDGQPMLRLNGKAMMKDRTWVKLEGSFLVETGVLTRWERNSAQLTTTSLDVLKLQLNNFITARVPMLPELKRAAVQDASCRITMSDEALRWAGLLPNSSCQVGQMLYQEGPSPQEKLPVMGTTGGGRKARQGRGKRGKGKKSLPVG